MVKTAGKGSRFVNWRTPSPKFLDAREKPDRSTVPWPTFIQCKWEELLDHIEPVASPVLPDAVREAMSFILDEMKAVCMVYLADFLYLLEAHQDVHSDSPEGKVDLVLADALYNVRSFRIMESFPHDIFNPEDMRDFVQLVRQILAAGARRHVFCSRK